MNRNPIEQAALDCARAVFGAGVAANLIALAYIAASDDDRDRAEELLTEAGMITGDDARGLTNQITEARSELLSQSPATQRGQPDETGS